MNYVAAEEEPAAGSELETLELELLLEAIFRRYGYDFREYAVSSMRRRVFARVRAEGLETISALTDRILHDPAAMDRLLLSISVHTTAMFRDPSFYVAVREQVVPILRTYPFVRVWHAGCSTGEEVYSMAILLHEEGLYEKCRIYATDMNEPVLRKAKEGIFPMEHMQDYTANYLKAGGKGSFSEYYTAAYESAIFSKALREHIVFAPHNLVQDRVFNEFNLIVCRNVMIYFNRTLQDRVHKLLFESLAKFGVLALGKKETLRFTPFEDRYEPLDEQQKIYRRVR